MSEDAASYWNEVDGTLVNRDGEAISLSQWIRLITDTEYKRVARTLVQEYQVSTVWTGDDHGWDTGGRPMVFETMVFDAEGIPCTRFGVRRYAGEDEARLGHRTVVRLVEDSIEAGWRGGV